MKHIKILALLVFQLAVVSLAVGQKAHLDNGRLTTGGDAPQKVQTTSDQALNSTSADQLVNGSDQDIPSERQTTYNEEKKDLVFPQDFSVLEDELLNSANMTQVLDQFKALKDLVMELRDANEELRLENRTIRKSLGSCCTATELGLSASDAYLMQNAPNPVQSNTQVEFFIPEGLTNATIEIRDIKGVLIESYAVETDGFGKLEINRANIQTGTYLYYLSIDGEVIDSKVMIIK